MPPISLKKVIAGVISAAVISVVTIILLIRYHELRGDLSEILTGLRAGYVLLVVLILVAGWLSDACRLRELGGAFGVPVPLRLAFAAVLAGNFSINVTPFFTGAGVVHIYVLKKRGLGLGKATAAIAGGAIISHVTQGILALLALTVTRGWEISKSIPAGMPLLLVIMAYLGGLLAIVAAVIWVPEPRQLPAFLYGQKRWENIAGKFISFQRGLRQLVKAAPGKLLRIVFFSAVYIICFYAVTPVLLAGLGSPQPLGYIIVFQLILFFAASLAPTPGSSGAVELGAFSLFSLIVPLEVLARFLVWWRLVTFFGNLALGAVPFVYFFFSSRWHSSTEEVKT